MSMTKEERRAAMPETTAVLDEFRREFGGGINRSMVDGMKEGTFHVVENGLEVGQPLPPLDPAKCVDADRWLEGSRKIRALIGDARYEEAFDEVHQGVFISRGWKP